MPDDASNEADARATAHALAVPRTARYYTLGRPENAKAVWFVLHGYGQLAEYFVRHFAPVAEAGAFVVAPEALSRFYLRGMQHTAESRIGASWMTRAAREHEMNDYVRYLDLLYSRLRAHGLRREVPVHLFGFSQGGATACRWAARGAVRPRWLTLWAGAVPPDLDLKACAAPFRRAALTLVRGSEDEYVAAERWQKQQDHLGAHGLAYRSLAFEGRHRIDRDTLRKLVGLSLEDASAEGAA